MGDCLWCSEPVDPVNALSDFGPSEGYCSSLCESAHGESILRSQANEDKLERAAMLALAGEDIFMADWEKLLAGPEGLARCRNCANYFPPSAHHDVEFCSPVCESDFHDAHARWAADNSVTADRQNVSAELLEIPLWGDFVPPRRHIRHFCGLEPSWQQHCIR